MAHPKAPDKVVLRVSSGGGFVTPQTNLRALPSFTLYGDGSVIVPGPMIMIYPAPAISALVRSKLTEPQVQALLRRAQAAGLLAPRAIDYGDMGAVGVTDMPTTTLVVNAAGRRFKREAYALGAENSHGRLSPAQAIARKALAKFIAGLPHGHASKLIEPRAFAVYVAPYQGRAQAGSARIAWQLKSDLATAGKPVSSGLGYRCIAVSGKDAKTLQATLRRASELSRWKTRSKPSANFQLIARPLLPDEHGCPRAGA